MRSRPRSNVNHFACSVLLFSNIWMDVMSQRMGFPSGLDGPSHAVADHACFQQTTNSEHGSQVLAQ
jgi:hypothetical protein